MNVLFIAIDDLRPELGCYGFPRIHSPNFDRLSAMSLRFNRAYVQQAVCSPSRTSLLTGRRPDTTHVYDLVHYFRNVGGNFTTLPEYFKVNGYQSIGMGKIFHPGVASGHDDPISWTVPYFHSPSAKYWNPLRLDASWIAVNESLEKEHPLIDTELTTNGLQWMEKLSNSTENFFLAIGWHKPHLPFIFPERFLQYYPQDQIHAAENQVAPVGMPPIAWSAYGELRQYHDIAKLNKSGAIGTILPEWKQLELRRGYYSAVSYTDDNLGQILDAYFKYGYDKNTIIVAWGDHGWQLGEHGEWCKHTNFELATHAMLMIHVPGMTEKGSVSDALVEFVDIYPTLAELAGLEVPTTCPEISKDIAVCTEGKSFVPLIKNPKAEWKTASFSQYPRDGDYMGYTMVDDKFRYTEWAKFDHKTYTPDWNQLDGRELYDHTHDYDENINVVGEEYYKDVVEEYSKRLHAGWRHAVPPEFQ